jgi:hypothetical protein
VTTSRLPSPKGLTQSVIFMACDCPFTLREEVDPAGTAI